MREAVRGFLNGAISNEEDTSMCEVDELTDAETAETIVQASNNRFFDRITTACRSIRSAIVRVDFRNFKSHLGLLEQLQVM